MDIENKVKLVNIESLYERYKQSRDERIEESEQIRQLLDSKLHKDFKSNTKKDFSQSPEDKTQISLENSLDIDSVRLYKGFVNEIGTALFNTSAPSLRMNPSKKSFKAMGEMISPAVEQGSKLSEKLQSGESLTDEEKDDLEGYTEVLDSFSERKLNDTFNEVIDDIIVSLNKKDISSVITEVIQNLAVVGNVCLYFDKEAQRFRVIPLYSYITIRSYKSNIEKAIIREKISIIDLPEEHEQYIDTDILQAKKQSNLAEITLYTYIENIGGGEIQVSKCFEGGLSQPFNHIEYKEDKLPYSFISVLNGTEDNYGYPILSSVTPEVQAINLAISRKQKIEGYIGTIIVTGNTDYEKQVQEIQEQIQNGEDGLGLSGIVFIPPARQGGILPANSGAVLKAESFGDKLRLALDGLENSIQNSKIKISDYFGKITPRNKERVTAEEINILHNDLQKSIKHIYPYFTKSIQDFVYRQVLDNLSYGTQNSRHTIDISSIKYETGEDYINRKIELGEIKTVLDMLTSSLPVIQNFPQIDSSRFVKLISKRAGLNPEDILFTDAEIEQQQRELIAQQEEQNIDLQQQQQQQEL